MAEIAAPSYLDAALRERFDALAPVLAAMGTLTALDADALARYVVSENEYLRVSKLTMAAIARGDAAEADRWAGCQDRLLRQCMTAGAEFGLTPSSRRARGLIPPR
ncbi:MAG: P27 family phage terminase small subunit [Oscillospiraceae bacterium]|nr:P27 family phage terminase small subunit [Oscillospiraceae bacterium]